MTERRSFLQFAPLAGAAAAVTGMALHPSATSAAVVPSGFSKMVASADASNCGTKRPWRSGRSFSW